jgi:hypothetical protein
MSVLEEIYVLVSKWFILSDVELTACCLNAQYCFGKPC